MQREQIKQIRSIVEELQMSAKRYKMYLTCKKYNIKLSTDYDTDLDTMEQTKLEVKIK
jgi:hypothetical protein